MVYGTVVDFMYVITYVCDCIEIETTTVHGTVHGTYVYYKLTIFLDFSGSRFYIPD